MPMPEPHTLLSCARAASAVRPYFGPDHVIAPPASWSNSKSMPMKRFALRRSLVQCGSVTARFVWIATVQLQHLALNGTRFAPLKVAAF